MAAATRRLPSVNTGDESAVNRSDSNVRSAAGRARDKVREAAEQATNPDGSPTAANPTFSLSTPGPARIGVPNFFIDKFRIPPFLLPIYQAAGIQYGVRWEILAAINEIETDYGRNLNVSSAGALGWMQFMPSIVARLRGRRQRRQGQGSLQPGRRDLRRRALPARRRRRHGHPAAVFAYNHADWYVDSVLLRAQVIGGLPSNLVGSLTGLTQGRFPIQAKSTYAGEIKTRGKRVREGNAAMVVESTGRRGIRIFSRERAPVVAVNDGRIVRIGHSKRLGNYLMLQDVYGNTYTYGHLGKVNRRYPSPKPQEFDPEQVTEAARAADARRPAVRRRLRHRAPGAPRAEAQARREGRARRRGDRTAGRQAAAVRQPGPPERLGRRRRPAGVRAHRRDRRRGDGRRLLPARLRPRPQGHPAQAPAPGSRIVAGTILGRLGDREGRRAPYLRFEVRPAGQGAPRIDPKPILDGWKLLESTAIYRAAGKNPFFGRDAANPSIGQILLMSKETLIQHVLANPRIGVYDCGRHDIQHRPGRPARAGHARVPRRLRACGRR